MAQKRIRTEISSVLDPNPLKYELSFRNKTVPYSCSAWSAGSASSLRSALCLLLTFIYLRDTFLCSGTRVRARVCVLCACFLNVAQIRQLNWNTEFTANGNLYVWPTRLFPNILMRYRVKIDIRKRGICANDQGLPIAWNKDYPCCIILGVLHSRNLWASIFLKNCTLN